MSDMSSLQVALSALYAQRRGVEVAAQNVANANTDGYSRQRVDLVNAGSPAVPAFWSTYSGTGSGVQVADITRYRDQFMEIQAALEHGALSQLDQSRTTLENLQNVFNEPSDTGLGTQLSDFWAGFDDVANNPSDSSARTQLLERANVVASSFNAASQQIEQQRADISTQLQSVVSQINTTAASVAQLNKAIKTATIAGINSNDLKDQRDLLANQLAQLSGATLRNGDFGQVEVSINGTALVQDDTSQSVAIDTTNPAQTVIRWTSNNAQAGITSGQAGGMLNDINTTLPSYLAKLDNVATTLRDEVNNLHGEISGSIDTTAQDQSAAGNLQFDVAVDGGAYQTVTIAGADWSGAGGAAALQSAMQTAVDAAVGAGNATVTVTGGAGSALSVSVTPATGHSMLVRATGTNTGFTTLLGQTAVGADGVGGRQFFTGTDASTLAVSADVSGNPDAIAAGLAANGPLDATRALDLADQATSSTGADAVYQAMIVQVGVDTQAIQRRDDIQQAATSSLDDARSGQSGVSVDEEMTNLVTYQNAYNAAARVMTVVDSMLDTLINHTGMTV